MRIAQNIAALLRQDAVGHVVHLSSLAVFGQQRGVMSEYVQPRPAFGHRYGLAKLWAERVLALGGAPEQRRLILRPGCIYGPGADIWVNRIARLIRGGRLGFLGVNGEGQAPVIHVTDVAAAVRRGAALQEVGLRHLIAPERLSWNAYFAKVARLLGVPLRDIGPSALKGEVWLAAPVRRALAIAGWSSADVITPSMARLFGNKAVAATAMPAFQPASEFRQVTEALDEALEEFVRNAAQHHAVNAAGRQHGAAYIA